MGKLTPLLILTLLFAWACDSDDDDTDLVCQPDLGFPYGPNSYASNHADAGNSDFIPCDGPTEFALDYHVLQGHLHAQPNTYSPDGKTTYATTTGGEDGCAVHAVDVATGEILWQRCGNHTQKIIASAVEVDQDGNLYLTDDATVYALNPADGSTRWETPLPDTGTLHNAFGVKFTPEGYIATQVSDGTLYLLDRSTGDILTSLDVAAATGFSAPPALDMGRVTSILPDYVSDRIGRLMGAGGTEEATMAIGALLGSSGSFVDNTIAVSVDNQIFSVGGGPDDETGTQIAVNLLPGPTLEIAWYGLLAAGSAASSAVSKDGKRLAVADGTDHIQMYDIEKCNANSDANADPMVCDPAWSYLMEAGSPRGSVTIDEEYRIYPFTFGKEGLPALVALEDKGDRPEVLWSKNYGEWTGLTSVATVTNNAIYGILTEVDPFLEMQGFPVPITTQNWAVAIDRWTGEILHQVEEPDDSECELQLAPDGSLFSTHMAVLSIISFDEGQRTPLGGLRRYTAE